MPRKMHAVSTKPGQRAWLHSWQVHRNIAVDDAVPDLAHRVAMQAHSLPDSTMAHLNWCLEHGDGQRLTLGVSAMARH